MSWYAPGQDTASLRRDRGICSLSPIATLLVAALIVMDRGAIRESLFANIGLVLRNRAFLQMDATAQERNATAGLAIRWLARSERFAEAETTFGFPIGASNTLDIPLPAWEELSDDGEFRVRIRGILTGQPAAVRIANLPSSPGSTCWTILTYTGDSTRIAQGSLIGFVLATMEQERAVLIPVRIGVNTAEWAYDFPDIPPRHNKPAENEPLDQGGLSYPLRLRIEQGDYVEKLSFVLLHPYHWEISPGHVIRSSWNILEVRAARPDSTGRCP